MNPKDLEQKIAPEPHVWRGYVLFLPYAVGSKSSGLRPYLISGGDHIHRLYFCDDNPFENKSLVAYHQTYCEVEGGYDESKDLISATHIKRIEDPFSGDSEFLRD